MKPEFADFRFAISLLLFTALTPAGHLQKTESTQSEKIARACQLAAESQRVRDQRPWALEESTLLAVESRLSAPLLDSDEALRSDIDLLEKPQVALQLEDPVRQLRYGHKNEWLVTTTVHNFLTLRNPTNGNVIYSWKLDGDILAFDISADDLFVAVSTSKRLWIFDTRAHDDVTPISFRRPANALAFAPRAHRLAITGHAHFAQVLDLDHLGASPVILQSSSQLLALAYSPSGNYVAAASPDGLVQIFSESTGKLTETLNYGHVANALRFSSDGQLLLVTGNTATATIFDVLHNRVLSSVPGGAAIKASSFNLKGSWVAIGGVNSSAEVFNAITGAPAARTVHQSTVNDLAFSNDGRWLASASSDRTIRVLDWIIDREIARYVFNDEVTALAFSPDSRLLAGASSSGELKIYKVADPTEVMRLPLDIRVTAVALSTDLSLLAVGGDDGVPRLFDMTGQLKWKVLERRQEQIFTLVFSPDDHSLLTGERDRIRVIDVVTSKITKERNHSQAVSAAAFSPDGQTIATGTDGLGEVTARVFSAYLTGKDLILPVPQELSVGAMAFSPSGEWFSTGPLCHAYVACNHDKSLRLYRAKTGEEAMISPMRIGGSSRALLFSHDSRLIVSGNDDNTAAIFEVGTGKKLLEIPHSAAVVALAMTDDDKVLVSGSQDGVVKLSDVSTGQPIGRIENRTTDIKTIKISKDGREIWTVAIGPTFVSVRGFPIHADDLIKEACSRLTRNFTPEEWLQYFPHEPYHRTCQNLP